MSLKCPIKTVLAIVGFAGSSGVPPPVLLSAAGVDPSALADPDAYLTRAKEIRLWDEAVRLTGDQDFGIHLAEWAVQNPSDHFDVLSFAARSSPTLAGHYRMAGRHVRLVHEGVYLSLEEEGDVACLVHGHSVEQIGPRHPVEGMLALTLLHARLAVGDDLAPRSVRFTHPRPARVDEHERIFRAPVHHGCQRNELVFERVVMGRAQRSAEPRLMQILERQLESILSRLPESRSCQDDVKRCIMDKLPEREPVVAEVAAKLRMSPRSLQRRLRSEGTSFAAVLSELRRDQALRYLQEGQLSIGEVAFLLGFLDVTAFHRAFKRWTGSTPAQHRRSPGRIDPDTAK